MRGRGRESGVGAIKNGNGVAISNFHDLAGEGVGEGRGSCQQQECGYDDPAHSRPSWVMTDQRLAKGHLEGNCGHSDIFMFQCIGRVETILVDLTASTCSYRIRQGPNGDTAPITDQLPCSTSWRRDAAVLTGHPLPSSFCLRWPRQDAAS